MHPEDRKRLEEKLGVETVRKLVMVLDELLAAMKPLNLNSKKYSIILQTILCKEILSDVRYQGLYYGRTPLTFMRMKVVSMLLDLSKIDKSVAYSVRKFQEDEVDAILSQFRELFREGGLFDGVSGVSRLESYLSIGGENIGMTVHFRLSVILAILKGVEYDYFHLLNSEIIEDGHMKFLDNQFERQVWSNIDNPAFRLKVQGVLLVQLDELQIPMPTSSVSTGTNGLIDFDFIWDSVPLSHKAILSHQIHTSTKPISSLKDLGNLLISVADAIEG